MRAHLGAPDVDSRAGCNGGADGAVVPRGRGGARGVEAGRDRHGHVVRRGGCRREGSEVARRGGRLSARRNGEGACAGAVGHTSSVIRHPQERCGDHGGGGVREGRRTRTADGDRHGRHVAAGGVGDGERVRRGGRDGARARRRRREGVVLRAARGQARGVGHTDGRNSRGVGGASREQRATGRAAVGADDIAREGSAELVLNRHGDIGRRAECRQDRVVRRRRDLRRRRRLGDGDLGAGVDGIIDDVDLRDDEALTADDARSADGVGQGRLLGRVRRHGRVDRVVS